MTQVVLRPNPEWERRMRALGDRAAQGECWMADYRKHTYAVLVTRDDIGVPADNHDKRWHVSISGENNVPPWNAMVAIAHKVRPGVCFVIGVPPESWWMNVHPNVLHLWELKDEMLLGQWRFESMGHRPS